MAKDSVCIGYVHGPIHPKFMSCILAIREYELNRGNDNQLVEIISHGGCYVAQNRNNVCQGFLDSPSNAEWLLFLDTDVVTRPDCLPLMTEMARSIPTDILAMPYPLLDKSVTFYLENPKELGSYSSLNNLEGDSVYELDGAGTGCLMIHRRVIVKLRDEYPEPWHWFGHDQVGFNVLGDDFTFCRRAKKHGFKIHGWTGWILEHWKSHPVEVKIGEVTNDQT